MAERRCSRVSLQPVVPIDPGPSQYPAGGTDRGHGAGRMKGASFPSYHGLEPLGMLWPRGLVLHSPPTSRSLPVSALSPTPHLPPAGMFFSSRALKPMLLPPPCLNCKEGAWHIGHGAEKLFGSPSEDGRAPGSYNTPPPCIPPLHRPKSSDSPPPHPTFPPEFSVSTRLKLRPGLPPRSPKTLRVFSSRPTFAPGSRSGQPAAPARLGSPQTAAGTAPRRSPPCLCWPAAGWQHPRLAPAGLRH